MTYFIIKGIKFSLICLPVFKFLTFSFWVCYGFRAKRWLQILAKAIDQRIESILSSIIHSDQTGFIKGRLIGHNVRLLNDIMEYTEAKNSHASYFLLIFARPSTPVNGILSTSVLTYSTLFQIIIRKWTSILSNNVESGTMNVGFMTNYFKVSQGCPLSPLLFVLAVEMLALKIRQN